MKKQRLGDWPLEFDVLTETEAKKLTHDQPPPPSDGDQRIHIAQLAYEDKHPHPATHHRLDDKDLD